MITNPYAVLGINQDATLNEIKSAYRVLVIRYHPDKNNGSDRYMGKLLEIAKLESRIRDLEKSGESVEMIQREIPRKKTLFREEEHLRERIVRRKK